LFGHNLFDGAPSTFAPLDRVPVTPDYVIGPGDEVVIRAWGQVDIDYRAVVDPAGAIHIPQVGTLTVAGLRYQDLHGFMRSAIGRVFRNFELNVSLGQLRSIQIFLVGQARRPGAYTVSSLSTLINALFASGGPSAKGTMRGIQLKRGNQLVTEFDVYDLLLKGDKSKDARLLPGDIIYIHRSGDLSRSRVASYCGIFELKNSTSLADLIALAGGLTTTASGQKVTVERIIDRTVRKVDEFALDAAGTARSLQDGDVVTVLTLSPRFENAVVLQGHVAGPARYPWREGMRVTDLFVDKNALIPATYWERQNRGQLAVGYSKREINWTMRSCNGSTPRSLLQGVTPLTWVRQSVATVRKTSSFSPGTSLPFIRQTMTWRKPRTTLLFAEPYRQAAALRMATGHADYRHHSGFALAH